MKRPEITKTLSMMLESYLNPKNDPRVYIAREVTFDYGTTHAIRVDYMRFKPVNNSVSGIEKGDFYCYEIKSSVADFRSGHGCNFIGDFNYLVMPEDVFESLRIEIPFRVGVLVPQENELGRIHLVVAKTAQRANRDRPISEMLLMMFRSCAREVYKNKRKDNKIGEIVKKGE